MESQKQDRSAPDRFIRNSDGHIVIAQRPNLPAVAWVALGVTSLFLHRSQLKDLLEDLSLAFLFTWSYLEITQGESPFRRMLGIGGMALAVMLFAVR